MMRLLEDMPAGVVGVAASGTLSSADYTDVLGPALKQTIDENGAIRVVLVFDGEFSGMQPGAMWQDLRTGVQEWTSWERVALVTDHGWMRDALRLFAWAVPGEVKAFPLAERNAAVAWAAATS